MKVYFKNAVVCLLDIFIMSQAALFILGYGLHFKETGQRNKDPSTKGSSGCRVVE